MGKGATKRTKATVGVARAVALLPQARAFRTVRVRVVLVPDIVEEVDLLFLREERGADAVHGRISPSLKRNM